MAVIPPKSGGSSTFGGLGGLFSAVGLLTGQPWLSGIGIGMNAIDGMTSGTAGGAASAAGSFDQMVDYFKEAGWFNPASGNIANTPAQNAMNNYEDLKKKWGPVNYNQGWGF